MKKLTLIFLLNLIGFQFLISQEYEPPLTSKDRQLEFSFYKFYRKEGITRISTYHTDLKNGKGSERYLSEDITYDNSGRINEIFRYSGKNKLSERQQYFYNSKNYVSKIGILDNQNLVGGEIVFMYDLNGRILSKIVYDKDNLVKYKEGFFSEIDSNRIRMTKFSPENKPIKKSFYQYEASIDNSNLKNIFVYLLDSTLESRFEKLYDGKGRIIQEVHYDGNSKMIDYIDYKYNEFNIITFESLINVDGKVKQKIQFKYDVKGRKTVENYFDENNKLFRILEFIYNEPK